MKLETKWQFRQLALTFFYCSLGITLASIGLVLIK